MAVVKLETKVEGFLLATQVFLEGIQIGLSSDGVQTFTSTDLLDVTGNLDIVFQATGVSGTDWKLTITKLEPQAKVIFQKSGQTKQNGNSVFFDSASVS
jgi:hypothetical protein